MEAVVAEVDIVAGAAAAAIVVAEEAVAEEAAETAGIVLKTVAVC